MTEYLDNYSFFKGVFVVFEEFLIFVEHLSCFLCGIFLWISMYLCDEDTCRFCKRSSSC